MGLAVALRIRKISFNDEGLYSISLTASDGSSTDVETKNNFIRVLPSAAGLPYWEGFESSFFSSKPNNLGGCKFKQQQCFHFGI